MQPLLEGGRTELWRGDTLRLPENYDLGPGSGPVDIMIYNHTGPGSGLGFVVVSGYTAGHVWFNLPEESRRESSICIDMDSLRSNWDDWFAYEWQFQMRVIDIAHTQILEWDRRMIVETP